MARKTRKAGSGTRVEFVGSANLPTLYVNAVQIITTPFDMRFRMGEVVSVDEDKIVIDERARITMSAEHAKQLLKILGDRIKKFEATHGPIRDVLRVKEYTPTAAAPAEKSPLS